MPATPVALRPSPLAKVLKLIYINAELDIPDETLKKPKKSNENFNIFIAYYLNKVRLIDNI